MDATSCLNKTEWEGHGYIWVMLSIWRRPTGSCCPAESLVFLSRYTEFPDFQKTPGQQFMEERAYCYWWFLGNSQLAAFLSFVIIIATKQQQILSIMMCHHSAVVGIWKGKEVYLSLKILHGSSKSLHSYWLHVCKFEEEIMRGKAWYFFAILSVTH